MPRFARPALRDYYADLGVAKTATHDDIKQAYRRLALEHHPDKKAPGEDVDAAEFRKAHEAFEHLRTPEKRKHYDERVAASQRRGSAYDNGAWEDLDDGDDDYVYSEYESDDDDIYEFFAYVFSRGAARYADYEAPRAQWQREADAERKRRVTELSKEQMIAEEEARDRTISQEDKMHDKLKGRARGASRKNCGCEGCMKRFQREQNEKDLKKKNPDGYKERMRVREQIARRREQAEALRQMKEEKEQKQAAVAAKKAKEEAADRARAEELRLAKQKDREEKLAKEAVERTRADEQRRAEEKKTREAANRACAEELRLAKEKKAGEERMAKEAAERAPADHRRRVQESKAKEDEMAKEHVHARVIAKPKLQIKKNTTKPTTTLSQTDAPKPNGAEKSKKVPETNVDESGPTVPKEQSRAEDTMPQEAPSVWGIPEKACQQGHERVIGLASAGQTTRDRASNEQQGTDLPEEASAQPVACDRASPEQGANDDPAETARIASDNGTVSSKAAKLRISQEYIQNVREECIKTLADERKEIAAEGVVLNIGWVKAGRQWKCSFCAAKNLKFSFRCPEGGAVACNRCRKKLSLVMPEPVGKCKSVQ